MEIPLDALLAHETDYFAFGAECVRTPCAWYLEGPELPDFQDCNRALCLRDDGRGPDAVAREVLARFRQRGLPAVADIDAVSEAQGIGPALRRLGVTPTSGRRLLMRYPLGTPPLPPPSQVAVEPLPDEPDADAIRLWVETAVCDDLGSEDEALWRAVAEREARSARCRLYLGRVDGNVAGACDLFSAQGWGRIDSVATRPELRRRGVASCLTARAVIDALALGDTVIYLYTEADSAAERVYRRIGFVPWGLNVLRRHTLWR